MKKLTVTTILAAVFATGCVSNSTYKKGLGERDQKIREIEDEKTRLQRALKELQTREEEQKKRLQEFNDLTQRFKKLIDAGTLSVRIVDGKMVVSLGSDVLFPSGSAKLSDKGLATIKDVSAQLVSIPDKKYQVEGHTDNVPMRTAQFPSNWELASARALSVVRTMVENRMPAARVSAASFGEYAPVGPNGTPEEKALNRRIEIVIVPDLSSLPGYEELQRMSEENSRSTPAAKPVTPAEPKAKPAPKAAKAPEAVKPAPEAKPAPKKSESSSSDVAPTAPAQ